MDVSDAIQKAGQILDQERVEPTVRYASALTEPVLAAFATLSGPLTERGKHPREVSERPEQFQFKSTNFDLLCAILDQVPEFGKPDLFSSVASRIKQSRSFRHRPGPVLGAGTWQRCTSELPLVAEFLVRRSDKRLFADLLAEAAASPGLTLLLLQLEEMIALNFTLFTEEEYLLLPPAILRIRKTLSDLEKHPKPAATIESNAIYYVRREAPELCTAVSEECRKARYLYLKRSLLPGMNLEVNQDKSTVRTFLEKLGFGPLLILSLDEAEKLYRTAATPFELKSSMGHLRSFLEQLHLQACALGHGKFGGSLPSKWGEAHQYLRDNGILTVKEQQFAIHFYTLMSDTSVHPLVAEREYARLMRNMSIEYGLLLLTKLDKLGLK
jgi:hypothetical protein